MSGVGRKVLFQLTLLAFLTKDSNATFSEYGLRSASGDTSEVGKWIGPVFVPNRWNTISEFGSDDLRKKGSTENCDDRRNRPSDNLLDRLKEPVDNPRLHEHEYDIKDKSETVLIPWMEPFPDNVVVPISSKPIEGVSSFRPKRGWEFINVCECCLKQPNSPCCRRCQRTHFGSNERIHVQKQKKPKVPKPHVMNFIQSTMCMCCHRAQVDTCCELCKKVDKLWCC